MVMTGVYCCQKVGCPTVRSWVSMGWARARGVAELERWTDAGHGELVQSEPRRLCTTADAGLVNRLQKMVFPNGGGQ